MSFRTTCVLVLVLFVLWSCWLSKESLATIGVGISPGKIIVKDSLVSGLSYKVPSVAVINTGDEPKEYRVRIAYQDKQGEEKPPSSWFLLNPRRMKLVPRQSQVVEVSLRIPRKAKPGDYFAYIEAYPFIRARGGASVGIAAATKLYFTTESRTLLLVLYYRLRDFVLGTAPGSYIALGVAGVAALIVIFRKFISVSFTLKRREW